LIPTRCNNRPRSRHPDVQLGGQLLDMKREPRNMAQAKAISEMHQARGACA
jgi:hypothetical protein